MAKRTIAMKLRQYDYEGLIIFAKKIHDGLQQYSGLYATPSPSLAVLEASYKDMQKKLDKWGKRGSIGGKPQLTALHDAREKLREHLNTAARYAMAAQPGNYQSWLEVGFPLKALPAKTGDVQAVQNFHRVLDRRYSLDHIRLSWKRPLGIPKSTEIAFMLYRNVKMLSIKQHI